MQFLDKILLLVYCLLLFCLYIFVYSNVLFKLNKENQFLFKKKKKLLHLLDMLSSWITGPIIHFQGIKIPLFLILSQNTTVFLTR